VEELRDSRAALERLLGEPVRVLCYPYGKQNAATRALARAAGYEAAVIARRRLNSRSADPLRLTRLRMEPGTRLAGLRWTLAQLRWLWWA
jgi:peptidoglycan/xylan/chitin deacetylase (PgdA/CDA1 family)